MNEWDWLPGICAVFLSLIYFYFVPVTFALVARAGGYGVGVGAFIASGALRRAQKRAEDEKPRSKLRKIPVSGGVWRLLRFVFERGRVEYACLSGAVSLGDAMSTALACGALWALDGALGERVRARVWPDFSGGGLKMEFTGIASMRLGHIMRAAVYLAAMIARERRAKHGQASH